MKRLIVSAPRKAQFEDVPLPICGDDQILVRSLVTAISTGSEIRVYRAIPIDTEGRFIYPEIPLTFPLENGYSMVGRVVDAGDNVTSFEQGDRVFATAYHREIAAVDAEAVVDLPPAVADEHAVFLNILEVGQIALRRANPDPGANVAIVGQGVIGLSVLAYCKAFGMRSIVVDPSEDRLAIARQMGADLALSPDQDDLLKQVRDFCGEDGADLAIEAAGVWPAIRTSMDIVRSGGSVVVVSRHTDTPGFSPVNAPYLTRGISLLTAYDYPAGGQRWDRRRSRRLTLEMLANGRLQIEPMITHTFDWADLPQVYALLDRGSPKMAGIVIKWHD